MPVERELLKSKIHRATVTEADVNYIGSISIDEDFMERADLWPGEKVAVWSVNSRERIETYAISALAAQDKSSSTEAPRIASRPAIS